MFQLGLTGKFLHIGDLQEFHQSILGMSQKVPINSQNKPH